MLQEISKLPLVYMHHMLSKSFFSFLLHKEYVWRLSNKTLLIQIFVRFYTELYLQGGKIILWSVEGEDINQIRDRLFSTSLIIYLPCPANWDQYHRQLISRRKLFCCLMLHGRGQIFHPWEKIDINSDIKQSNKVSRHAMKD